MTGDPRFHELLRQIGELHDKKQQDYGADSDPFANVRASERWGIQPWVGALVRLNDKVHRLQQFAKKGELANESAEDSMMDIAVYALIALILYREETADEFVPPLWSQTKADLEERIAEGMKVVMETPLSVQEVSTPTAPFTHAPCRRCQMEGFVCAGQEPAGGLTTPH